MGFTSWFQGRASGESIKQHEQRMYRAAGVGSVKLICHRDVWRFVDHQVVLQTGTGGVVLGERIKSNGEFVEVALSGAGLARILDVTHRGRRSDYIPSEQAIAKRVYDQISQALKAVDPKADPGHPIPPIVLDDKRG